LPAFGKARNVMLAALEACLIVTYLLFVARKNPPPSRITVPNEADHALA